MCIDLLSVTKIYVKWPSHVSPTRKKIQSHLSNNGKSTSRFITFNSLNFSVTFHCNTLYYLFYFHKEGKKNMFKLASSLLFKISNFACRMMQQEEGKERIKTEHMACRLYSHMRADLPALGTRMQKRETERFPSSTFVIYTLLPSYAYIYASWIYCYCMETTILLERCAERGKGGSL